ncbi:hypothetical protein [Methanonatronarchaeum sp. AMET6-2]|uniref:hypothetical protein n=1 Tax=Methanonatronarchaeum sp. AMET6-2 TaxID=2933293 RepID=UPI00122649F7|nr:hypothetical protein [Methanonatronarchaeum sp. AMET6-2]RZN61145.1 MAG: hypothetical protein EF811_05450 [Methanonatronarchaeia archaeon]UOY09796.1 hypothetical protein MU439_05930 [Methanonatronarchaeum sp. AMET6-2]
MATGVVWEIMKFVGDVLFGTTMQYGLSDTVADLFWNLVGASIAAVVGQRYLKPYKNKLS